MTPLDRLRALHAAVLATGQPLNPRYAMGKLIACVDALQLARQFIANGIELGYIKMPQADTRDSARATLPAIDAALAPLVKEEP